MAKSSIIKSMNEQQSITPEAQPYYNPAYSHLSVFEILDRVLLDNRDAYITYTGILQQYYGLLPNQSAKGNRYRDSLVEARQKISKVLASQGLSLVYANGRDCSKGFKYPPEAIDPMAEERDASKKLRMKQVERLIQNSKGLFPDSWLADLVGKRVRQSDGDEPIIIFDGNLRLNRIELLPVLYDAIESKRVIRFRYNPGYRKEALLLTVHPYRLKEYNQRWFLFCKSEKVNGLTYGICALDRIGGTVEILEGVAYKPCKKGAFGASYFEHVIGVTRLKGNIEHIVLLCYDDEAAGRIHSKHLHHSQKSWTKDGQTYFSIDVIPNEELYARLLSYGSSLSVLEPTAVREEIAKRITSMMRHYT